MNKDTRIKSIVFILMIISCAVLLISCGEPSKRDDLKSRVNKMNDYIYDRCCGGVNITESEMKLSLNNFYEIQKKYSGKLFYTEGDQKYYYPKFVCVREDINYTVTKNTRYDILMLDKDENGVYTGIKISAYEDEADQKKLEMNNRLKGFTCSFCSREHLDMILAIYKEFQDKNSGTFMYEEYDGKKVCCPKYTYCFGSQFDEYRFNARIKYTDKEKQTKVFWRIELMEKNYDGFYTGLKFVSFEVPVKGGSEISTKDLVKSDKSFIPDAPALEADDQEESQETSKEN